MEKKVNSSAKTPEKNTSEPLYTVAELAESSEKVFGKDVRKECVMAGVRDGGKKEDSSKKEATKEEAKKIVTSFLKKEVK